MTKNSWTSKGVPIKKIRDNEELMNIEGG
jgi:hypothetical protein